jgi:hypothetical protein
MPSQGTVLGAVVFSVHEAQSLELEGRSAPKGGNRFVSDDLAAKRSLIVLINRAKTNDKPAPVDDYEVVQTFFHELAEHAAGAAQEKVEYGHGSQRVEELNLLLDEVLPSKFQWPEEPKPGSGLRPDAGVQLDSGVQPVKPKVAP